MTEKLLKCCAENPWNDPIYIAWKFDLFLYPDMQHALLAKVIIDDPSNYKLVKQIADGKDKAKNALLGKVIQINKYNFDGDLMMALMMRLIEIGEYEKYTDEELKRWS